MKNKLAAFAGVLMTAGSMLSGQATAQDFYVGDELVDVKINTIASTELAAALGAIAVPLCKKEMRSWHQADPHMYVAPEAQSRNAAETSRSLKKRFTVAEREAVVVGQPVMSPFADAGFKLGDVLPANTRPTRVPVEPGDTYREREWAAFEQDPEMTFTVRRGEETKQVKVRYRMDCGGALFVRKNRYRFAQSSSGLATRAGGGIIVLTYPLVKSLSLRQQAVVMAHEIGQTATGANLRPSAATSAATAALGTLFFGANASNGDDLRKPEPEKLVDADHVAMWLMSLVGVYPDEYVAILTKLESENDGFMIPEYKTTRPLSWDRKAALSSAVAMWQKEKMLPVPRGYTEQNLAELRAWAASTGLVDQIKKVIEGAAASASR